MRTLIILLLLVPRIGLGDQTNEPRIPEGAEKLCRQLFEAIRIRDIGAVPKLFGTVDHLRALSETGCDENATDKNRGLAYGDYMADCRRIMDQVPKTGLAIAMRKIDSTKIKVVKVESGMTLVSGVRIRCRYGLRLGRFSFSPPPMIGSGENWYFIDRFEGMIRFEILDAETGG